MKTQQENYHTILQSEKRRSHILTYALPIAMFILIYFIITEIDPGPGGSDSIGLSLATVFLYIIVFQILYIPRRGENWKKDSSEIFFKKIGFERMVIRHQILKQLHKRYIEFFVFTVVFVILMLSIIIFLEGRPETNVKNPELLLKMKLFLMSVWFVPGIMVYDFFFYKNNLMRYLDSELYFAFGCFKIIKNFKDLNEFDRTNFAISAIKHYDNYLRNNLKLQINKIERIYEQFIVNTMNLADDALTTILNKLESDEKLDFLRYLADMTKQDPNNLLVMEKSSSKLKSALPFILSLIASLAATGIVITIQFILGN
ncbi:MAG: hypothetical protein WD154_02280 [Nitrosopumilaceae archaeon]